jgi:hypothetical protein
MLRLKNPVAALIVKDTLIKAVIKLETKKKS